MPTSPGGWGRASRRGHNPTGVRGMSQSAQGWTGRLQAFGREAGFRRGGRVLCLTRCPPWAPPSTGLSARAPVCSPVKQDANDCLIGHLSAQLPSVWGSRPRPRHSAGHSLPRTLPHPERQDRWLFPSVKSLSRTQLFETPWTIAYQAPLSMGFSRLLINYPHPLITY